MKNVLLFLALLSSFSVFGQFTMTTGLTPTQMADAITGDGVDVSNATMSCDPDFYGQFNGAPVALGFDSGIFLGSGEAMDIIGTSTGIISGQGDLCVQNQTHQDPDLGAILNSNGSPFYITEPCALEFDATTQGDTLKFRYVFGSEEYTSYVCNGFNDLFGFFVTGQNPAGGMYNSTNIATIPGTNIPVAINTVNDGTPNGSDAGCLSNNTAFYAGVIPNIIFEGNTVVLEAILPVVPCASYHYKLVIADAGDCSFDSGVFIEAGSLTANTTSVASSTVLGAGFTTAVEGCVNGQFTFTIQTAMGDSVVNFFIGGTAQNGVDYLAIPDSIDFAGDTSITIVIQPIADNISEGNETVEIYVEGVCPGTYSDTAILEIADRIPITVTPAIDSLCVGDSVNVVVTGAQTYSWSPITGVSDPNSPNVWLSPTVSSFYTLTYGIGNCIEDTVVIMSVSGLDVATALLVDPTCPGADDGYIDVTLINNISDVDLLWNNGDTTNLNDSLTAGTYTLTIDDGECQVDASYTLNDPVLSLDIVTPDTSLCVGEALQLAVVDNLNVNAVYNWSPANLVSDSTIQQPSLVASDSTTLVLTGTNPAGCSVSDTINIYVNDIDIEALFTDTLIPPGASVAIGVSLVSVSDPSAAVTYSWSPTDFLDDIDLATTSSTPDAGILYTVLAESSGCIDTATIRVTIDVDFSVPNAFSPNGDGVNDLFYAENVLGGSVREFRVYNEWGQLMHNDAASPWDGTYSGVLQPQGIYYYYMRVANGSEEEIQAGSFNLLH